MTADKLLQTLTGSYHDGTLEDAAYNNGNLYLYCFRNPFDPEGIEDVNTRYIIIRFENVTELEVYNWKDRSYVPYTIGLLSKENENTSICGIDYLDYENGLVVFGECMRFRCNDVAVLEHSSEALDFSQYHNL